MDSIPECIDDPATKKMFEYCLKQVTQLPDHARKIGRFCQKVKQLSRNPSKNLILDVFQAYNECGIPDVYDSIHGEGNYQNNDFVQKYTLNPIEDVKCDDATFLECANKHCSELATKLLHGKLFGEGCKSFITIISIYFEAQQITQFSEELKQILTRVNEIYEIHVKEALLILYNHQINKIGEAKVHLMSAEKALKRELENLEMIKSKSRTGGIESLSLGVGSAIACYNNFSSLYYLAECVNRWTLFSNVALGLLQFISTAWSLKLTYGHFKNYQQASEAIEQINKYIGYIEDSAKIIDNINNNQFDEKMEQKLIDIQIQIDEFLAKKFEQTEQARVKQIEEDIKYAKKLAESFE